MMTPFTKALHAACKGHTHTHINKCYNGGLNYLEETRLYPNCIDYDFKSSYPNILANEELKLRFSINKGYQKKYNSIDEIKKLCINKKNEIWIL